MSVLECHRNDNIGNNHNNNDDDAIYRLGRTDKWACRNCKIRDDIHFMQIHNCSGKR
jgi:hypothetical protein